MATPKPSSSSTKKSNSWPKKSKGKSTWAKTTNDYNPFLVEAPTLEASSSSFSSRPSSSSSTDIDSPWDTHTGSPEDSHSVSSWDTCTASAPNSQFDDHLFSNNQTMVLDSGYTGHARPSVLPALQEYKLYLRSNHASNVATPVFTKKCGTCNLFYKKCMFTPAERERELYCRWCLLDKDPIILGDDGSVRNAIAQCNLHCHLKCNEKGQTCRSNQQEPSIASVYRLGKQMKTEFEGKILEAIEEEEAPNFCGEENRPDGYYSYDDDY